MFYRFLNNVYNLPLKNLSGLPPILAQLFWQRWAGQFPAVRMRHRAFPKSAGGVQCDHAAPERELRGGACLTLDSFANALQLATQDVVVVDVQEFVARLI